jgi:hypothetical protein
MCRSSGGGGGGGGEVGSVLNVVEGGGMCSKVPSPGV